MNITKKITMSLDNMGNPPVVNAVQSDSNTRSVAISLFFENKPWEIPEGTTAAVRFKKPDGKSGLYDTLPNEVSAYAIDGNVVTVTLAPEVLTAEGDADVAVALYNGNDVLGTFPFVVDVAPNPAAGKPLSNNYYSLQNFDHVNAAYNNLLARIQKLEAGSAEFDWFGCVLSVNGKNPDADGNVNISGSAEVDTEEIVATVISRLPIYDGEVVEE